MAPYSVEQYFADDYPHTLFPLKTTQILVEFSSAKLRDFIYKKVLTDSSSAPGFLVQQRCYAAKKAYSLRRTVKLDPIAEFFIYDVVFRNKKHFRKDHRSERQSFGYRFVNGRPETTAGAYGAYKAALANARTIHGVTLKVDVATYFNAIYHHDMVHAMRGIGWAEADVDALGRFLREINAGRSIDCLPQGIHPTKTLGSEFLRFIDSSYRLKAAHGVRFLDDIHLFDDSEQKLTFDLITLQELLGEKGLSLNDTKTRLGNVSEVDIPAKVDRIKQSLLRIRRRAVTDYFDDDGETDAPEPPHLRKRQTEYLLDLLQTPDIDESDAELVLVLLREYGDQVLARMQELLKRYPGLTKNLYAYSRSVQDRSGLADLLSGFLADSPLATEYQLFWLVKLAEEFLHNTPKYGDILSSALEHPNATTLTRAKVLEIDDKRFGLPELRENVVRSGASNWEAWAAAAGMRGTPAPQRNHLLMYFAKGSAINGLIADCIRNLP